MVRRDDTKTQALAASRTLNPRPEKVTDRITWQIQKMASQGRGGILRTLTA